MKIEQAQYMRFLKPYKEEHVYLAALEMNPGESEIVAQFRRGDYPYSKSPLDYLAASEAVLFVTQLSYVLCGLILEMKLPTGEISNLDTFVRKIDEDKVHLTNLSIKFRRKIPKAEDICVRLRLKGVRRQSSAVHIKAHFDIESSFYGDVMAVMLI